MMEDTALVEAGKTKGILQGGGHPDGGGVEVLKGAQALLKRFLDGGARVDFEVMPKESTEWARAQPAIHRSASRRSRESPGSMLGWHWGRLVLIHRLLEEPTDAASPFLLLQGRFSPGWG